MKNVVTVIDNMDVSESDIEFVNDSDFFKKKKSYKVIEWATVGNTVDCGVFAMRHMKTWFNETELNLDSGFPLAHTPKRLI
ncbi:hypothetical protein Hanom_Chr07g00666821 [Helianthus anomalus]